MGLFFTLKPGSEHVFPMEFWVFTNVPDLGATEHEIAPRPRQYLNKTRAVKWLIWSMACVKTKTSVKFRAGHLCPAFLIVNFGYL